MKMFGKSSGSGVSPARLESSGRDARALRKRRDVLKTRDFWRALSEASWPGPQTPVLRRLHD